jgi:heterotetrameric sarcosine oxidase gamma subunit
MVDRPQRLSPLAGATTPGEFGAPVDGGPRVILSERLDLGLLHLAGPDADAFYDGARGVVGASLPRNPNTASEVDDRIVLWTGPGTWLIATSEGGVQSLAEGLRAIACAGAVSVVDLSHGRTVVRIGGPAARDVLATGCSIDLHPRRFLAGDCAQTSIAGIALLIHAVTDDPVYDLYLPRGFALSAWEWLSDAAAEFGCRIEETA